MLWSNFADIMKKPAKIGMRTLNSGKKTLLTRKTPTDWSTRNKAVTYHISVIQFFPKRCCLSGTGIAKHAAMEQCLWTVKLKLQMPTSLGRPEPDHPVRGEEATRRGTVGPSVLVANS
jgi:hypothetical protein